MNVCLPELIVTAIENVKQQAGPRRSERGGHGIGVFHVTGANYSKRHRVDRVVEFVDGTMRGDG